MKFEWGPYQVLKLKAKTLSFRQSDVLDIVPPATDHKKKHFFGRTINHVSLDAELSPALDNQKSPIYIWF